METGFFFAEESPQCVAGTENQVYNSIFMPHCRQQLWISEQKWWASQTLTGDLGSVHRGSGTFESKMSECAPAWPIRNWDDRMSDRKSKRGISQSIAQLWQGIAPNKVQYRNAFGTELHSRLRWPKFAPNPKSDTFFLNYFLFEITINRPWLHNLTSIMREEIFVQLLIKHWFKPESVLHTILLTKVLRNKEDRNPFSCSVELTDNICQFRPFF